MLRKCQATRSSAACLQQIYEHSFIRHIHLKTTQVGWEVLRFKVVTTIFQPLLNLQHKWFTQPFCLNTDPKSLVCRAFLFAILQHFSSVRSKSVCERHHFPASLTQFGKRHRHHSASDLRANCNCRRAGSDTLLAVLEDKAPLLLWIIGWQKMITVKLIHRSRARH